VVTDAAPRREPEGATHSDAPGLVGARYGLPHRALADAATCCYQPQPLPLPLPPKSKFIRPVPDPRPEP